MAVDEGVREEEEGVRKEDDPAAALWLPVVQQLNQMQHSDNSQKNSTKVLMPQ